jgi:hypothetical protein
MRFQGTPSIQSVSGSGPPAASTARRARSTTRRASSSAWLRASVCFGFPRDPDGTPYTVSRVSRASSARARRPAMRAARIPCALPSTAARIRLNGRVDSARSMMVPRGADSSLRPISRVGFRRRRPCSGAGVFGTAALVVYLGSRVRFLLRQRIREHPLSTYRSSCLRRRATAVSTPARYRASNSSTLTDGGEGPLPRWGCRSTRGLSDRHRQTAPHLDHLAPRSRTSAPMAGPRSSATPSVETCYPTILRPIYREAIGGNTARIGWTFGSSPR